MFLIKRNVFKDDFEVFTEFTVQIVTDKEF
jgi:hypothetical protein